MKSGDPLVTLSAAEFQARLNQAQAQLNQAAADYKRYQFLFKEGAASPQEFGAMEARYKTAQAVVNEAATLKGYTVVKAPGGRGGGGAQGGGGGPGPARADPGVPV